MHLIFCTYFCITSKLGVDVVFAFSRVVAQIFTNITDPKLTRKHVYYHCIIPFFTNGYELRIPEAAEVNPRLPYPLPG
jgi:hypothetical protein